MSSFAFGNSGWIVAPQWATQALRCLVDPTDLTGQVNNITISAPSIKYPIDNLQAIPARWACETSCFANNPTHDLQAGLGEREIKAESIRCTACADRDLIADASLNLEQCLMRRVAEGFR